MAMGTYMDLDNLEPYIAEMVQIHTYNGAECTQHHESNRDRCETPRLKPDMFLFDNQDTPSQRHVSSNKHHRSEFIVLSRPQREFDEETPWSKTTPLGNKLRDVEDFSDHAERISLMRKDRSSWLSHPKRGTTRKQSVFEDWIDAGDRLFAPSPKGQKASRVVNYAWFRKK
ncbi:hypothetical protein BGZ63DRAFT_402520 [Mariannaea sp. PMI_226]|nr:hypothetical protein BGZ63DRAFT_402520 [Mariannaea sp. PMI_226]